MKTYLCAFLLSLATVQSFAPNPSFGGRRASLVQYKNAASLTPLFATDKEESGFATVDKPGVITSEGNGEANVEVKNEEEEELTETEKLMKQVKASGTAGVVSYALWELAFWAFSVPVCILGYHQVTGHWPDLSDSEDLQKLGAEAFAFVNFARFAVPLRIGLALSTTPWIQENVVDRFKNKEDDDQKSTESAEQSEENSPM